MMTWTETVTWTRIHPNDPNTWPPEGVRVLLSWYAGTEWIGVRHGRNCMFAVMAHAVSLDMDYIHAWGTLPLGLEPKETPR